MGQYEPRDSRNVTGTAATPDGHWTGQAANDPTLKDAGQDRQAQMQQAGQSVGQSGDGVSGAANQGNDHTSAIGRNQGPGGSQAQQFQDTAGQHGAGGSGAGGQFADQIAKHQEVVDALGAHVGTVDHVDGDRIKLTRKDSPDGEHHYVALSEVAGIEGGPNGGRVRLSSSGDRGAR